MNTLGIDVGGSGIKGALVDVKTGELKTDRLRIETPQPPTPEAVIKTIDKLIQRFRCDGPIGVGFPAIVMDGVVLSAANIDDAWIGYPGAREIAKKTGCKVRMVNDADAAGMAEMRFGAGRGRNGVVMILTLGCFVAANARICSSAASSIATAPSPTKSARASSTPKLESPSVRAGYRERQPSQTKNVGTPSTATRYTAHLGNGQRRFKSMYRQSSWPSPGQPTAQFVVSRKAQNHSTACTATWREVRPSLSESPVSQSAAKGGSTLHHGSKTEPLSACKAATKVPAVAAPRAASSRQCGCPSTSAHASHAAPIART